MNNLKDICDFIVILIIVSLFSFLLSLITKYWLIILGIIFIMLTIFYSKLRGIMGEFWVKHELKKLPKDNYRVLNNIMLDNNGMTYQIDHLIISSFGIFVIEMKNFYGYIFGDIYKEQWMQILGKKRKHKYYFMNPIHQNYGHVKTLESLLELDNNYFISIVCFSNQVQLSNDLKNDVVQLEHLVSIIKKYQTIIINQQDLDIIYNKILDLNVTDKSKRKKHIKNIRTKIVDKQQKINNMICPRCGGKLLVKKGKYGSFLGCSHYPLCKFTINK